MPSIFPTHRSFCYILSTANEGGSCTCRMRNILRLNRCLAKTKPPDSGRSIIQPLLSLVKRRIGEEWAIIAV